jgi:hypothetical protein
VNNKTMLCLEALHCLASSYPTQSKLLTPVEESVLADWSGWYVGVHVGGAIRDGFDCIDCDSRTTGPRSAGPQPAAVNGLPRTG